MPSPSSRAPTLQRTGSRPPRCCRARPTRTSSPRCGLRPGCPTARWARLSPESAGRRAACNEPPHACASMRSPSPRFRARHHRSVPHAPQASLTSWIVADSTIVLRDGHRCVPRRVGRQCSSLLPGSLPCPRAQQRRILPPTFLPMFVPAATTGSPTRRPSCCATAAARATGTSSSSPAPPAPSRCVRFQPLGTRQRSTNTPGEE